MKSENGGSLVLLSWFGRIALFINYFWFGMLKFFPGVSPAEMLAGDTINTISAGILTNSNAVFILAFLEVALALSLLFKKTVLWGLRLMLVHMILTFSTFVFYPELMLGNTAFSLTLAGQYVVKNLVFIALILILVKQFRLQQNQ